MVHRSSYEGVCTGHSRARIATHPSSLQGNLKPSNFLLRHNQAFTGFQGTLKPSNFFLPISRGSCWRLLISMLSFSHNLLFLSTSQHENMETQKTEVKNFGLFGEKDLLGARQGSWKCKKQDKNNKSVQTKKKVVGRFSVAHKMSLSQQKARTFVVKLFLFSSLGKGVGVLW